MDIGEGRNLSQTTKKIFVFLSLKKPCSVSRSREKILAKCVLTVFRGTRKMDHMRIRPLSEHSFIIMKL